MLVATYYIFKDIEGMTGNLKNKVSFQPFYAREEIHKGNVKEHELLYCNLPKMFLNELQEVFRNHFNQWRREELLPFLIASDPPIATAYARWLLHLPIPNEVVSSSYNNKELYLPAFIAFSTEQVPHTTASQCYIYKNYKPAIEKIAHDAQLFEERSEDMFLLQQYVKETILPLPSNTQLVESKIKDITHCKKTGRSEATTTYITQIRSQLIQKVTKKTVVDPNYINRKKRSNDSIDYLPGRHWNKNLIDESLKFFPEVMDDDEYEIAANTLDKSMHFKEERTKDEYTTIINCSDKRRRNNSELTTASTSWTLTPFLLGYHTFRRALNKLKPMYRMELVCRGVLQWVQSKDKPITELMKLVKEHEHPILSKKEESDMTDEEVARFKAFKPTYLTSSEWEADQIDSTLATHFPSDGSQPII